MHDQLGVTRREAKLCLAADPAQAGRDHPLIAAEEQRDEHRDECDQGHDADAETATRPNRRAGTGTPGTALRFIRRLTHAHAEDVIDAVTVRIEAAEGRTNRPSIQGG